MDGVAGLLVYGVFAVCILAVLISGAGVYGRIVSRDNDTYEARTGIQYLATRFRQAELTSEAEITQAEGCTAVRFPEKGDGGNYYVYVYCYDGYIRELFLEEGAGFSPAAGEKILPAQSAAMTGGDGMIKIDVTFSSGETRTLYVSAKGGDQ